MVFSCVETPRHSPWVKCGDFLSRSWVCVSKPTGDSARDRPSSPIVGTFKCLLIWRSRVRSGSPTVLNLRDWDSPGRWSRIWQWRRRHRRGKGGSSLSTELHEGWGRSNRRGPTVKGKMRDPESGGVTRIERCPRGPSPRGWSGRWSEESGRRVGSRGTRRGWDQY